jgi:hypothetical protein
MDLDVCGVELRTASFVVGAAVLGLVVAVARRARRSSVGWLEGRDQRVFY